MVRMKKCLPETRSIYYMKPGQTLENTKVSERALALIVPRSVYERFSDNTPQYEKFALLAEREAKRIAAIRQASYEMSKTWDDTPQNIQKRRKEELLSRKKIEETERIAFTKEMAAQNAIKRAEIVKHARELLLYRKPQCRLINNALLISECYRELNEQVKFNNSMKDIAKKQEEEYAKRIMEDIEKFHQEEKIKHEARLKKLQIHNDLLDKQVLKNKEDLKKLQDSIRKTEVEDLKNMSKEIEDIKRKELQLELEKKKALNKMFLENIEEKRRCELKAQEEEEFREKSMKIYTQMKQQMEKKAKEQRKRAMEEKIRRSELMAKRTIRKIEKKRAVNRQGKTVEQIEKEVVEQKNQEELQKIEEKKQKKEKDRQELLKQMKIDEEERERRKKGEMDVKLWETLQRYKRVEFDKEWERKHREKEKNNKLQYGNVLKKQMKKNDALRKIRQMEEDDAVDTKEILKTANEKVLSYAEKVLQESRGVRPLYPIIKTIEEFKREAGLIPHKSPQAVEHPRISKRKRGKRAFCTKPVAEENILYLS